MRLGSYTCSLQPDSLAENAYGQSEIQERHRHRWELNNLYADQLTSAGLKISGVNPDSGLAEIVELTDHPWFVGVQFHPELKSTVETPHPLFVAFVAAALRHHAENAPLVTQMEVAGN